MSETTREERMDLAQQIAEAADDGGTIQAVDMVRLIGDPTQHTCMSMGRAARLLGCVDELAVVMGCTPADI